MGKIKETSNPNPNHPKIAQMLELFGHQDCKVEILSTILLALFRTKFACILAISNPVLGGNHVRVVCERV